MVTLNDFLHVRTDQLEPIRVVGFQGNSLEEERKLFDQLRMSFSELSTRVHYLVILPGIRPFAAVPVTESDDAPAGMTSYTIPGDEYVIFRFEEKDIGAFWDQICTQENQTKYRIDLSKPRYEIFSPALHPTGLVEWYIPAMR